MKAPDAKAAGLSDAKRRLLAARLKGEAPPAADHEIPRRAIEGPVPATRLQEAMWVLSKLTGDHAAYNIHFGLEFVGSLDAQALSQSIAAVGRRHESLRSTFENRDGRLFIVDCGAVEPNHTFLDVRGDADPKATAEYRAVELARRSFDLHEAPLWRTSLIRFGDDAWLLVFVVHHIVCDERSLELLIEDLLEHYRRRLRDAADLPPRERDYRDYACWLSDCLSKHTQRHLDYWRTHLGDGDGRIELPTDFPRGPRQNFSGALAEHEAGAPLAGAVAALARDNNASPFVVLLAAFNFLMDRYTGDTDVTVGTPVSLRGPSPTSEMVGLFINALPLRSQIDHATGFDQLLASTRDGFIAALEHKELPFEDLVAALAPRRDASHNPFFQVMFVMETELVPSPVPDLDVRFRMFDTGTAKFDLTVFARLSENRLRLSAEYNADLFEEETVRTLLSAYDAVLDQVTARPQRPLARIGIVPESLRGTIVAEAWGPSMDLSGAVPLSDQILEQAARNPTATAVVQGERRIDYAHLEQASAGLAAALVAAGHAGNDPVAVVLERGPDYPNALLAVLRAGGAYVPIDAGAPPARLEQVIRELRAGCNGREPLAICAAHDSARVSAAGAQPVTPDVTMPATPARSGPSLSDRAYVIYTSGSTGRPKGVAVTQANLAASNLARNVFYGGAPECFLLVSPFHFDSSVAGIYWTLAAGGRLILPAADSAADPRHLATTIANEGVTHVLLLPSFYALLLEAASPGQLDSLKTVIVAGEALSRALVEDHAARLPNAELVNEYGPTEGTVWTTAARCRPDRRPPSIGRPIANAGAYVLDRDLNPLIAGAAGELCIAGAGVAEGYYLQPEQTAERFLDDPLRGSGRIYRSGDRVRRRSGGSLDFLGRMDAQLKISGYRIEPAEIETALVRLDGIDEAAVVARKTPGDSAATLVAWCVSKQSDPSAAAVGEALAETLPDYLVPRTIRFCESLPRTGTGKIDRQALGAKDISLPAAEDGPRRTLSPTERRLAGLWRTLLGAEELSQDSHFFDLGGHSLLGVTLMLEIDRTFDCPLPLSALFESPTLAGLARRIDGVDGISAPFEFLNPYQIGGSRRPLFVVQGDVREIARQLGPEQPIYLAYRSLDGIAVNELSVERYARLTLDEILRVQPTGPYQIFGFSFGGQIALEMARMLARDGEQMAVLGLIDPPSTEKASYARLEVRRLRARLQDLGGPLAQFGHLLRMAPQFAGKLFRRGWQRLRAAQHSRSGKPLSKELVLARDRAYYIRTSAGYRYERYDGDLLLIVPEGHADSGERTISAWQSLVGGRLTSHVVAGARAHEDLLRLPWRKDVAAVIEDALAAAAKRVGETDVGGTRNSRSEDAAPDDTSEVRA